MPVEREYKPCGAKQPEGGQLSSRAIKTRSEGKQIRKLKIFKCIRL